MIIFNNKLIPVNSLLFAILSEKVTNKFYVSKNIKWQSYSFVSKEVFRRLGKHYLPNSTYQRLCIHLFTTISLPARNRELQPHDTEWRTRSHVSEISIDINKSIKLNCGIIWVPFVRKKRSWCRIASSGKTAKAE